jgi:hypothetical protein
MPNFVKPPVPPPPLPVRFHCPDCGQSVSFSRAELDETSGMSGQGVTPWTRRCRCGAMMRRITAQAPPP